MPEQNEVYDPETKTWYRLPDPDLEQRTEEPDDEPTWKEPTEEPILSTTPCDQLGKRHKYKDRKTGEIYDHCLVCGVERATATKSTTPKSTAGAGGKVTALDTLLSGAWMALGMVVRNVVPEPSGPAAGKMIQLEAGIAGPKLHKALRKTPLYPYLAIATNQFGWLADISMLIAPPILIGLAAAKPELALQFKPVLVTALVPVLAEAAKKAEAQRKLLESLEGYSQETIDMADALIDNLIGNNDKQSEAD